MYIGSEGFLLKNEMKQTLAFPAELEYNKLNYYLLT